MSMNCRTALAALPPYRLRLFPSVRQLTFVRVNDPEFFLDGSHKTSIIIINQPLDLASLTAHLFYV